MSNSFGFGGTNAHVVLEAVKNRGSAIQFADPCLQPDHEIVRVAS